MDKIEKKKKNGELLRKMKSSKIEVEINWSYEQTNHKYLSWNCD